MSLRSRNLTTKAGSPFFAWSLTKRQKVTLWVAAFGLLVLTAGCGTPSAPTAELTILPVETVQLSESQQLETLRTYSGVVRAARTSELGFERTGQLVEVTVDEGDRVYAGQSLAKMDTRNLQARLEQLQAEQKVAKALLQELEIGPRAETIAAQRAEVAGLKATHELQKLNLKRRVELRRSNTISQEEFDSFQFETQASAARLLAAEQRLLELENGTRAEKITAQRAAVERLDASIEDVQVDLADSELVAPFSGTISQRYHDEGTILPPASKLLRLVETDRLEVWIGMPARAVNAIKMDQPYPLQVDGNSFSGIATERLPELDPATRTQTVVFSLANSDASNAKPIDLVPGQLARVSVVEQQDSKGFWVPTTALVRSARGLWSVYALESGESETIQRRDVEVIYTRGDRSYIRGTVTAGEEIVAMGTHRIVPGQRVQATRFYSSGTAQVADTTGGQGE